MGRINGYLFAIEIANSKLQEVSDAAQENLNNTYEELRGMVDERVSLIGEYFSKATEQMQKFIDIYNTQIEKISSDENLYGKTINSITDRFELITSAAQSLNSTLKRITRQSRQNFRKFNGRL